MSRRRVEIQDDDDGDDEAITPGSSPSVGHSPKPKFKKRTTGERKGKSKAASLQKDDDDESQDFPPPGFRMIRNRDKRKRIAERSGYYNTQGTSTESSTPGVATPVKAATSTQDLEQMQADSGKEFISLNENVREKSEGDRGNGVGMDMEEDSEHSNIWLPVDRYTQAQLQELRMLRIREAIDNYEEEKDDAAFSMKEVWEADLIRKGLALQAEKDPTIVMPPPVLPKKLPRLPAVFDNLQQKLEQLKILQARCVQDLELAKEREWQVKEVQDALRTKWDTERQAYEEAGRQMQERGSATPGALKGDVDQDEENESSREVNMDEEANSGGIEQASPDVKMEEDTTPEPEIENDNVKEETIGLNKEAELKDEKVDVKNE